MNNVIKQKDLQSLASTCVYFLLLIFIIPIMIQIIWSVTRKVEDNWP